MLFDILTFDCYGTLVDWEGGISEAFAVAAPPGATATRDAVVQAYTMVEPQVQAGPFQPYAAVLAEAARRVADRLGWESCPEEGRFLPATLPDWRPFPDAPAALQQLHAAGARLGILSNVDDDLLADTREHLPPVFEFSITAEQVRAYKPAHTHFLTCRSRIGSARWLHVAQSWFHDVIPATQLGVPVAWINRKGEERGAGGEPVAEFTTLEELVEWVSGER